MEFEAEQAVILASGTEGDNLGILTEELPPALLPVANRPLLSFQLELLEQARGFRQVLVLTFERWLSRLSTYISEHYKGALQVELLVVPNDSSSADALRHIKPKLTSDFVLLAGDVISDVSFHHLADLHRLHRAAVTCLFKQSPPRELVNGTMVKKAKELDGIDFVGMDKEKRRLLYLEPSADCDKGTLGVSQSLLRKEPHLQIHTDLTDAHVYIFSHWVLEVLESKPHFASIKFELVPYLVHKQFLTKPDPVQESVGSSVKPSSSGIPEEFCCCCSVMPHDSGYCVRANSLPSYVQANMDVAKGGLTRFEKLPEVNEAVKEGNFALRSFSADSSRGVGVDVSNGCVIKKSCVGPHCTIGSNVRLTNCIIMDHVKISDKVTIANSIICSNAEICEGVSLKDAQVGFNVTVEAGAVIKGEAISQGDLEDDE
ncbi:hypothetical protein AB1Y20_007522 [Prymnesium parvum]|uniref:Translation initiation factor eIF2B subunit gamma n=1 Tax=Prymnesium parvum TaxID=97485 RepID=A0AB34IVM5_PRYPA